MSRRPAAWVIVMRREILAKLTDRAFLVGTLFTLVVLAGVIGVQGYLGERTKTYDLVATAEARPLADQVATAASKGDAKVRVKVTDANDAVAAHAAVDTGSADAWLHHEATGWVLTGRTGVPDALATTTTGVVRSTTLAANAAAAGTTVQAMEKGATLTTTQLVGDPQRSDLNKGIGFGMAVLFYVAVLMFGITLANSVVEEKQSRIVEIIVSAIPIRQLLAGKILGNALIAFVQMAVYAAIALVGISFTSVGRLLPSVTGPVLWFVLFFAVGFLAIACLYAVAGALASRTEDVQSTSMPLTMLVMGIFFGSAFASGTAQTVGSFIPPFSAVMMPIRMLDGGVPWWQPVLALAGLLAFAFAAVVLGEKVYRRALLQTRGRLSVRQALAAAE